MNKDTPILMCAEMVRATLRGVDPKTQTRRVVKPQPEFRGMCSNRQVRSLYWASPRYDNGLGVHYFHTDEEHGLKLMESASPYGQPGDRLWVKETFIHLRRPFKSQGDVAYRCTDTVRADFLPVKWTPSIFMPRWASRIALEVVAVRVERVQEINYDDALAEGILRCGPNSYTDGNTQWITPQRAYQSLWNLINLAPAPRRARHPDGHKFIDRYESFPWSSEDFDARHPGVRARRFYRGKPITVTGNPWVWVVEFKKGATA